MKYMGSKDRLAKELLPIILADSTSKMYYEPFAGGMNMIQHVPFGLNRFANDNNIYLVEFWKAFVKGWRPPYITKDMYKDVKKYLDDCPPCLVGWVGFNCSYSGKWFGGYAGEVYTKGGIRNYINEALSNCEKQATLLQNVSFRSGSYFTMQIEDNSIVYCDPPYESTTKYHSDFRHDVFWQWVRNLSERCKVFVSEYNAPNDFECIWKKSVKSSLSANGKSGASITSIEKLFVYKP